MDKKKGCGDMKGYGKMDKGMKGKKDAMVVAVMVGKPKAKAKKK